MENDKKHLDIDLEFLDKNEPTRVTPPKLESPKGSEPNWRYYDKDKANANSGSGKKYKWKNILIIGGVVIFFGWVIFSNSNSKNDTNTGSYTPPSVNQVSSNSNTVVIGEYRCLSYNYDRAVALTPSESEQQIDTARNDLEYKSNELDRLKNKIDSSYVDEYSSQYEINQYNETVNDYNIKLTSYKRDEANFNSRVERYNTQIEAHNNYLRNNCTLNR
ncbi:MAG: hypothetical protein PHE59_02170 [Patescibacteria group bacterium]|nr:hypothetical protein [Patescibacteria group bacterium]